MHAAETATLICVAPYSHLPSGLASEDDVPLTEKSLLAEGTVAVPPTETKISAPPVTPMSTRFAPVGIPCVILPAPENTIALIESDCGMPDMIGIPF
jgi:hypothetical protein